ncbi:hypothetical protein FEM08_21260 [Flavobacterium gilvum]|nr:hypothetical protein FEM08_21260 [Flavobacterium gilvum]
MLILDLKSKIQNLQFSHTKSKIDNRYTSLQGELAKQSKI